MLMGMDGEEADCTARYDMRMDIYIYIDGLIDAFPGKLIVKLIMPWALGVGR